MKEVLIQFQGFHPSEFTRSYLDSKLDVLQEQAPYGSSIRAIFKRKNKTFTASIRILSSTGQCFVTASGKHMRQVSHQLNERVRRQLGRWKAVRVRNGGLNGSLVD